MKQNICRAYHSQYDNCVYLIDNPAGEGCMSGKYGGEGNLVGYGNPACCPNYQKDYVGGGQMPMKLIVIPRAEVESRQKAMRKTMKLKDGDSLPAMIENFNQNEAKIVV